MSAWLVTAKQSWSQSPNVWNVWMWIITRADTIAFWTSLGITIPLKLHSISSILDKYLWHVDICQVMAWCTDTNSGNFNLHDTRNYQCSFTYQVKTCFYVPMTHVSFIRRWVSWTRTPVMGMKSQWQGKELASVHKYKCLPNKWVMEKVWHLFIWLFSQWTVIGAFITSVMGTWLGI